MNLLLLTTFVFTALESLHARADLPYACGVYSIDSFGDTIVRSLTQIGHNGQQTLYRILNDENDSVILVMAHGVCYCVKGEIKPDLRYNGDRSYKTVKINKIDNSGCTP